jgi:hypothetical protein
MWLATAAATTAHWGLSPVTIVSVTSRLDSVADAAAVVAAAGGTAPAFLTCSSARGRRSPNAQVVPPYQSPSWRPASSSTSATESKTTHRSRDVHARDTNDWWAIGAQATSGGGGSCRGTGGRRARATTRLERSGTCLAGHSLSASLTINDRTINGTDQTDWYCIKLQLCPSTTWYTVGRVTSVDGELRKTRLWRNSMRVVNKLHTMSAACCSLTVDC